MKCRFLYALILINKKLIYNYSHDTNIKMNSKNEKLNLNLKTYVHSISKFSESLTELIIYSPRLIKTIDIGEFIKFQNYHKSDFFLSEPVALTPVYLNYKENLVYFMINEIGSSTKILSNLKHGEKIVTMGAIGSTFNLNIFNNKKVLFICEDFLHYLNLFLLTELFNKKITQNITFISNDLEKIPDFYKQIILKHSNKMIDCYNNDQKMIHLIDGLYENFDYIILGIKNSGVQSHICNLPIKIINFINAPLQCMMHGICSKCVQQDKNGEYFFNCGRARYILYDSEFSYNNAKMGQHSVMEKINYLKLKQIMKNNIQ